MNLSHPLKRTFLRMGALRSVIGKCPSAIYLDIQNGVFPQGVPLGGRAVGWPSDELDAIVAARLAGFTDDQMRALVKRLVAERANATAKPAAATTAPTGGTALEAARSLAAAVGV